MNIGTDGSASVMCCCCWEINSDTLPAKSGIYGCHPSHTWVNCCSRLESILVLIYNIHNYHNPGREAFYYLCPGGPPEAIEGNTSTSNGMFRSAIGHGFNYITDVHVYNSSLY